MGAAAQSGVIVKDANLEGFPTVRNGTAQIPNRNHTPCMARKKSKKESGDKVRTSVKKEMAEPRIARSAKIAELKLEMDRIPTRPSTTVSGTVDRIVTPRTSKKPEKAQIAVDGQEKRYRTLRVDNTLTDRHGEEVSLKKGARVEVTVSAEDVNWRR
jgi:hypothetical protein